MSIFEFYKNIFRREMIQHRLSFEAVTKILPLLCGISTPNAGNAIAKSRINPSYPAHRIGYTLIYCAYLTGVVEHFVQKVLTTCKPVHCKLEHLIKLTRDNPRDKSGIHLCSVGGGPGADIVGAMLGFTILAHKEMFKSIFVLENSGCWRTTFNLLIKCLKTGSLRVIPRGVFDQHVHFELQQSDFLNPFPQKILDKIKKSNVVLLIEWSLTYPENVRQQILQNIMEAIKAEALVFFLDHSQEFTKMFEAMWAVYGNTLYGPVWLKYTLPYMPKEFVELYGHEPKVCGTQFCMVVQKNQQPPTQFTTEVPRVD